MAPKTLTGLELDLDDAPARDADLFLVDGNNLAYRAFFALPEELATSEGFPTGALLGFTNMLFKLLSDYKPKGVAVAWDTRPVHRAAAAEAVEVVYKEGRKPMADLLREQFPYFRPIVEAFGYRNLEFEGWEADDVIATLATDADGAGIRTCVVSTDRDAFQLVTGNVCLMMTPRGVSDVQVYTPERVEARYGCRPDQIPDFIGLKGDTSDNIPGVAGIGDKTAGQLIAQYGSLEYGLRPGAVARAQEEPDGVRRPGARVEGTRDDAGATSSSSCDPAQLVLAPPDRSELREMFRRSSSADCCRVSTISTRPCRPRRRRFRRRHRGRLARGGGAAGARGRRRGGRRRGGGLPSRPQTEVVVAPRPAHLRGELIAHDAKAIGVDAVRRHDAARVSDRARPQRVPPRRPRGRVRESRRSPCRMPRRSPTASSATPR